MGFDLESVDAMTGAIFMGWGGAMPGVWTLIGALLLIYALWSGMRHEHEAYKKLKK